MNKVFTLPFTATIVFEMGRGVPLLVTLLYYGRNVKVLNFLSRPRGFTQEFQTGFYTGVFIKTVDANFFGQMLPAKFLL